MPRTSLLRIWSIVRVIAETVMLRLLRWRVDVQGLEHVPTDGPAVVAFNHHGYVDFVLVGWPIVARLRRPLRFLGKREVFSMPVIGWIARAIEAVPVDREDAGGRHGAFGAAVEALEAGDLVAIAPEQTISTSYELLPFRTGAVRMAQAAGVPIIPAIGFGSHRFAGKGTGIHVARRIAVSLVFGAPLHVAADEDPVAATGRLQDHSAAILEQILTQYPDRTEAEGAWWFPHRLGGGAPDHATVLAEHEARTRRWDPPAEDDA